MRYSYEAWPPLDWETWKDTATTLHMFLQIVGKTRLALTPVQNHWWNVPLYLTARGLGTSPMLLQTGDSIDIEFDFIRHDLVFRTSNGETRHLGLKPMPVKTFFVEYLQVLSDLCVPVHLDRHPVEVSDPIPFDEDVVHHSYDPDAASRFWHALRLADFIFKKFSTTFYGKISPVHFFWGSMDLAVTRFNGKRAPAKPDGDLVQAEAYSHEVISTGFWPGNGGYGRAAFYAYAAPVPEGLNKARIGGPGSFNRQMGEFLLDYRDVIHSPQPFETVMNFLMETYAAAANLAGWDRDILDRHQFYAKKTRASADLA